MSKIVKTIDGHQGELLYIKDNTAFIQECNGEVWYCPKTDIINFNEFNMPLYPFFDFDELIKVVKSKELYYFAVDEEKEEMYFLGKDYIKDLQSQLDQQKAMWNELKEYLIDTLKEKQNSPKYYKLNEVLDKMEELEQGEKDD